jgi:membrane-associated phospholipid phosphatase
MISPLKTIACRIRRLICPIASVIGGAGIAILACGGSKTAAAQELPALSPTSVTATNSAAANSAAAPVDGGATLETRDAAGQGAGGPAAPSPPQAESEARQAPTASSNVAISATSMAGLTITTLALDGANTSAQLPETGSALSQPPESASEGADGVSAGMPVWKLLVIDVRSVFTAPARWTGGEWALFGVGVAGVAALTRADNHLRTEVLRSNSSFETHLADGFRPFGSYAAFGVLGAFYAGGLLGHDAKAQETALDGLIASGIAAGIITPVLKEAVGRSRPSAHKGVYDFHPFSGSASFPSGEATEAFAVGSVIATEYHSVWVDVLAYGTATMVGFARMREDAHWASDVVMGALIGTAVGRTVVHVNHRLRARMTVAPLIAPGARGLTIQTAF